MEKIIFFILVILILGFVLYLGGKAIKKGIDAKSENKNIGNLDHDEPQDSLNEGVKLTEEIEKLNKLLESGVLTQEEFEKTKKKILEK